MIGKLSVSNAEFAEFKHTIGLSQDASTFTGANYMNLEIRQTAVLHIRNAKRKSVQTDYNTAIRAKTDLTASNKDQQ